MKSFFSIISVYLIAFFCIEEFVKFTERNSYIKMVKFYIFERIFFNRDAEFFFKIYIERIFKYDYMHNNVDANKASILVPFFFA